VAAAIRSGRRSLSLDQTWRAFWWLGAGIRIMWIDNCALPGVWSASFGEAVCPLLIPLPVARLATAKRGRVEPP